MNAEFSGEAVRLAIVKGLIEKSGTTSPTLGVGDDGAVIQVPGGGQLVIASDFVRGSEFYLFQLGYLNYFDVGYYLIAANISDMAAMGVRPAGILTVVRYTKTVSDEDFAEIFAGMEACASRFATPIVGGDTGGYVADVFAATAFGFCEEGRFLTRDGASEGDILCVTGEVGGAIAALSYFKELKPSGHELPAECEEKLLRRWKRPDAKVEIGYELAACSLATSCMDVSDGLRASVDQLGSSSGVAFRLQEASIPIDECARAVAELASLEVLKLAASASVDFELLFTVSPDRISEVRQLFAERSWPMAEIGVASLERENVLVGADGSVGPLPGTPWDHQQGDHVKDLIVSATNREA